MIELLVNRASITRPDGVTRIDVPCLGDGSLVVALCPPADDDQDGRDKLSITAPVSGAKVGPGYDFDATHRGLSEAIALRDALLATPVPWGGSMDEITAASREHRSVLGAILRKENIRRQWESLEGEE